MNQEFDNEVVAFFAIPQETGAVWELDFGRTGFTLFISTHTIQHIILFYCKIILYQFKQAQNSIVILEKN